MNPRNTFGTDLQHARQLHARGQHGEAEQHYRELLARGEDRESVLRCLVELYMHQGRIPEVVQSLIDLTEVVPDRLYYYGRLAALLDGLGQTEAAIGHYHRLLDRQPDLADAYFNIALLYKKTLRYQDALSAYRTAIDLDIDNLQEVYANIGVLYADMRQYDDALKMYESALAFDPGYVPALFNLAGLYEETGNRQKASCLYKQILTQDPQHYDSQARLAYMQRVGPDGTELISRLRRSADECRDQPLAREGLLFALGKALDDTHDYDQAITAYSAANELGQQRFPAFNEQLIEDFFQQQIDLFTPEFIQSKSMHRTERPIFICGMLRSGSTLVEQILASHNDVQSGGELEYLPWLVNNRLSPYPAKLLGVSQRELDTVASDYLAMLSNVLPGAGQVTDKRPDNFIFLGLIKILFPQARIIYTRRNAMDNCLSVYFQQLGGNLNYSTSLEAIGRYYRQHERLMDHWRQCFKENIFCMDYEQLVVAPEPAIRSMLEFLELPWADRCLHFHQSNRQVKSASLWQVREPLHDRSSGRWKNYADYLGGLRQALEM